MKKTLLTAVLMGVVTAGSAGAATINVAQADTVTQSVTRYTVNTTNVRTGPGTGYRVVSTLSPGMSVTGTLVNGWITLTAPATLAGRYVSASVLTASAPTGNSIATTITGWIASSDHSVNARSGPGLSYPIVSRIAKETKVSGTASGDWMKISSGYINLGLIETSTPNIFNINGFVPTNTLCPVPLEWNAQHSFAPGYTPQTQRYFNCAGLVGLTQLENAYQAAFGHWAEIDLTYRDHAEEVYWWTNKQYAASPVGSSNHGWALAIDFREDDGPDEFSWGHSGYNWLAANGAQYGFAGDPVPYGTAEESYHWNFVG